MEDNAQSPEEMILAQKRFENFKIKLIRVMGFFLLALSGLLFFFAFLAQEQGKSPYSLIPILATPFCIGIIFFFFAKCWAIRCR